MENNTAKRDIYNSAVVHIAASRFSLLLCCSKWGILSTLNKPNVLGRWYLVTINNIPDTLFDVNAAHSHIGYQKTMQYSADKD